MLIVSHGRAFALVTCSLRASTLLVFAVPIALLACASRVSSFVDNPYLQAQQRSSDLKCFNFVRKLGFGGTGSVHHVELRDHEHCKDLSAIPPQTTLVTKVCDCVKDGHFTMICDPGNNRVNLCKSDLSKECQMVRTVIAHVREQGGNESLFAQCHADRTQSAVPHIVSAFAKGTPVDKLIFDSHEDVSSDSKLTLSIAKQLFKALRQIYHAGIVHGDIKPANALWSPFTLLDFAFARNEGERFPPGGDENYLAPEVLRSDRMYFPRDIWAGGIFVLELLCAQAAAGSSFQSFVRKRKLIPERSYENARSSDHELTWGFGGLADRNGAKLKVAVSMYCGSARKIATAEKDAAFLSVYSLLRNKILKIDAAARPSASEIEAELDAISLKEQ